MWIETKRCLVCIKDPQLINVSSPSKYKSRYKKEIKQRQGLDSIQLNTGAKEGLLGYCVCVFDSMVHTCVCIVIFLLLMAMVGL